MTSDFKFYKRSFLLYKNGLTVFNIITRSYESTNVLTKYYRELTSYIFIFKRRIENRIYCLIN